MVRTNSKHISERQGMTKGGPFVLPPWFKLAIVTGLALAVVLLASSISTYRTVSRGLIVDHLRSDLHAQAVMMEEQAQRDSVQTRSELLAILQQALKKSNGRIVWILVLRLGRRPHRYSRPKISARTSRVGSRSSRRSARRRDRCLLRFCPSCCRPGYCGSRRLPAEGPGQ
jgi:hypothetical protein